MSKETYLYDAIKTLEGCMDLMVKKGKDYQGGSVCDDDYYPHGWKSFDTMLTTKVLRFRSVMEQQGNVNFDTAEDCLKDLINYSARAIVWLNRHTDNGSDDYHYSTGESVKVKKDQGINNDRFTPDIEELQIRKEIEELPYNGA